MNNKLSRYSAITRIIIRKTLKFCIYWIAMFLAMNDKVGFPFKDEHPKTKL